MDDQEEVSHISKTVYIDTVGPRGKKYGWLSAVIQSRNEDGSYVARYCQGKKHTTVIHDINDENIVRFSTPAVSQA